MSIVICCQGWSIIVLYHAAQPGPFPDFSDGGLGTRLPRPLADAKAHVLVTQPLQT